MGFFKKKRAPITNAAGVAAAAEKQAVDVRLTKKKYKLEDEGWKSEGGTSADEEGASGSGAGLREAQRELASARACIGELESAVTALQAALGEARARATAEGEKYNLIEFKYQLLVDMWTMRVLDNDAATAQEEAAALQAEQQAPAPVEAA